MIITKEEQLTIFSGSALSPTQTQALQNYLPDKFLPKIRNLKNITEVLKNNTSTLTKIKKNIGITRTEALIKVYLIRLNDLMNLKRPLSCEAIDEIASNLVNEYYMLSMTDIVFVLQQAAKGKYGEFYDSLNMAKVMKWFSNYFDDRCNTAEEISNQERSQHYLPLGHYRSDNTQQEQREFSRQYAIKKLLEKHKKI